MTGKWAAINTLRANAQHFLEGPGTVISGAELHHSEECPGCKQDAALALVEAALDEADLSIHWFSALLSVIEKHDKPLAMGIVAQAGGGQIRLANLAAALRAVREGK